MKVYKIRDSKTDKYWVRSGWWGKSGSVLTRWSDVQQVVKGLKRHQTVIEEFNLVHVGTHHEGVFVVPLSQEA